MDADGDADDDGDRGDDVSGFGRITEDVMMMMGDSHITRILYYGYFSWTWLVVSPGLLLVSTARGVHVRHSTWHARTTYSTGSDCRAMNRLWGELHCDIRQCLNALLERCV